MSNYETSNFDDSNRELLMELEMSDPVPQSDKINAPFDFLSDDDDDDDDSVQGGHQKEENWDPFDFDDEAPSEKSYSMLEPKGSCRKYRLSSKNVARLPLTDIEDESDFFSDGNTLIVESKADKSVQTENFELYTHENEESSCEIAKFLESTINLRNVLSNCSKNFKRGNFIDRVKNYSPISVSGNVGEQCKSLDAIEVDSWNGSLEEVEGKPLRNVLKRLKRSEKTIKRYETEDRPRNDYFDLEDDPFVSGSSSAQRNQVIVDVYDERILEKSVETILASAEMAITRDWNYLKIVWKNSQIENGMDLLQQILECDLQTTGVRTSIFNFFKKIVDSFDSDTCLHQNLELEFKASFVTVTCSSPYLYLDLIPYCIERLLLSKRRHQSSVCGKNKSLSILYLERQFVLYRLLKNLLEKFSNDLKDGMTEPSDSEESVTNRDAANASKLPDFGKKNKSGRNENFAGVTEWMLSGLNDLVSFSKSRFPLTGLIISECHDLVRHIHKTIVNFCKLPVKNKQQFDFYSCTF